MSKQQFMNKPTIKNLSSAEKERRWAQHRANKGQNFTVSRPPPTVEEPNPIAAVTHTFPSCAVHYLQALENPFTLEHPACIPDLHSVPSKKIRAIARSTFSTGINGDACAILCPHTKVSTGVSYITTTSVFPSTGGLTVVPVPGGVGITGNAIAKLPYSGTAFAAFTTGGIEGRVVGCGIRIRYTGREIDRAGQIVAFRDPDNENVASIKTFQQLRDLESSQTFDVSREWTYCHYKPCRPDEYEYSRNGETSGVEPIPGGISCRLSMGFLIVGAVPSTGFECEVVTFIEYVGNIDNVSHTHSDITSMSQIRNATPMPVGTQNPHLTLLKSVHKIGKGILKHASPMVKESIAGGGSHSIFSQIGNALTSVIKNGSNALSSFNSGFTNTVSNAMFKGLTSKVMQGAETYLPALARSGFTKSIAELLPMAASLL